MRRSKNSGYSITSSALARSEGGTVRPISFANSFRVFDGMHRCPIIAASAGPSASGAVTLSIKKSLKHQVDIADAPGRTRNDERTLMLARLGDVLYGTACVLAVLFAVIVSLTPGNNFKLENFIGVIVIWLIARACRYVLAGR
jgi:hypothetical protein